MAKERLKRRPKVCRHILEIKLLILFSSPAPPVIIQRLMADHGVKIYVAAQAKLLS
jgi:hypothetical protein